eukprot:gene4593-833_t
MVATAKVGRVERVGPDATMVCCDPVERSRYLLTFSAEVSILFSTTLLLFLVLEAQELLNGECDLLGRTYPCACSCAAAVDVVQGGPVDPKAPLDRTFTPPLPHADYAVESSTDGTTDWLFMCDDQPSLFYLNQTGRLRGAVTEQ